MFPGSPRAPFLRWNSEGLPGSWGVLPVPLPCSATPAAPSCHAFAAVRCCPRSLNHEGRSVESISRLIHKALTLAVYASKLRISLHWQDSLPAGGKPLPGGTRTHWTPLANFKCDFTCRLFQRPRISLAPSRPDTDSAPYSVPVKASSYHLLRTFPTQRETYEFFGTKKFLVTFRSRWLQSEGKSRIKIKSVGRCET
jgi:hypothetical protein